MVHGDTVAKHSIKEACLLAGKGRMTIYRHMDSGKLSYGVDHSGKRFLETAELIRVYGEIKITESQNGTKKCTTDTVSNGQNGTPDTLLGDTNALLALMLEEIKNLKQETKELRKALTERKALPAPASLTDKQFSANESFGLSKEEKARNDSIKSSLARMKAKFS